MHRAAYREVELAIRGHTVEDCSARVCPLGHVEDCSAGACSLRQAISWPLREQWVIILRTFRNHAENFSSHLEAENTFVEY